MMADKAGKHSQLSVVSFDPRTKLYALLIFNIVMLTSLTEGVSVYLKPFLAILAFLFLLNARMTKTAVIYLVLYVVSWNAEFFLQYISGMSLGGFLIRFFSHMITRIVPGFMFAYYMLRTTRVINVNEIVPETLFKNYSIVFQDVVLFNDTIYNNIKIGKENATREEVIAAAKLAQCDEFIDRLSMGYDTIIGENGKTLSGGERQRLSIARAFLKDAPVILLDESTASIDPENETKIQEAIGKLIKDKTVLIIAHKLRSIVECDKIVVLKEGHLVEEGTHNELLRQSGLYHRLYSLQNESMDWTVKAQI